MSITESWPVDDKNNGVNSGCVFPWGRLAAGSLIKTKYIFLLCTVNFMLDQLLVKSIATRGPGIRSYMMKPFA